MRSGLGPRAQLEAAGITTLLDIPAVGQCAYFSVTCCLYLFDDREIWRVQTFKIVAVSQPSGASTTPIRTTRLIGIQPTSTSYLKNGTSTVQDD